MDPNVVTIAQDATVREAAELLQRSPHSTLAVVDDRGRLVGQFGTQQLLRLALPEFAHLAESLLSLPPESEPDAEHLLEVAARSLLDVMGAPRAVTDQTSILAAMALMTDDGTQAVFVTSGDKPVGVVTRDHVLAEVVYPGIVL